MRRRPCLGSAGLARPGGSAARGVSEAQYNNVVSVIVADVFGALLVIADDEEAVSAEADSDPDVLSRRLTSRPSPRHGALAPSTVY